MNELTSSSFRVPGEAYEFATTHWSVVLAAKQTNSDEAKAALEILCRTYWNPIYAFVCRDGHDSERAKDVVQSFFLRLLERNDFGAVQQSKGRLRSYLLASLKHFLINERARASAQKRGGGLQPASLDELIDSGSPVPEAALNLAPDKLFDRQWALAQFDRVISRLAEEYSAAGRSEQFELFKRYLTDGGAESSQAEIAAKLGLAPASVKVLVHRMRGRYREMLRDEMAQTVGKEADIESELRELISILRS